MPQFPDIVEPINEVKFPDKVVANDLNVIGNVMNRVQDLTDQKLVKLDYNTSEDVNFLVGRQLATIPSGNNYVDVPLQIKNRVGEVVNPVTNGVTNIWLDPAVPITLKVSDITDLTPLPSSQSGYSNVSLITKPPLKYTIVEAPTLENRAVLRVFASQSIGQGTAGLPSEPLCIKKSHDNGDFTLLTTRVLCGSRMNNLVVYTLDNSNQITTTTNLFLTSQSHALTDYVVDFTYSATHYFVLVKHKDTAGTSDSYAADIYKFDLDGSFVEKLSGVSHNPALQGIVRFQGAVSLTYDESTDYLYVGGYVYKQMEGGGSLSNPYFAPVVYRYTTSLDYNNMSYLSIATPGSANANQGVPKVYLTSYNGTVYALASQTWFGLNTYSSIYKLTNSDFVSSTQPKTGTVLYTFSNRVVTNIDVTSGAKIYVSTRKPETATNYLGQTLEYVTDTAPAIPNWKITRISSANVFEDDTTSYKDGTSPDTPTTLQNPKLCCLSTGILVIVGGLSNVLLATGLDLVNPWVRIFGSAQQTDSDRMIAVDTMAYIKSIPSTLAGSALVIANGDFDEVTRFSEITSISQNLSIVTLRDKPDSWGSLGILEVGQLGEIQTAQQYRYYTNQTLYETTAACSLKYDPILFVNTLNPSDSAVFVPYTYIPNGIVDITDLDNIVETTYTSSAYVYPYATLRSNSNDMQAVYGDLVQDVPYDSTYYGADKAITITTKMSAFVLSAIDGGTLPVLRSSNLGFVQFLDSSGDPIAFTLDGVSYEYTTYDLQSFDPANYSGLDDFVSGVYHYKGTRIKDVSYTIDIPNSTEYIRIGYVSAMWPNITPSSNLSLNAVGVYGGVYLYDVTASVN